MTPATLEPPRIGSGTWAQEFTIDGSIEEFADRVSGSRLVLIGEASHGTEEFYAVRAALTRELIEHHGYAGVAAEAFKALAERSINIRAITTSEIKFSLLIDAAFTELAVRTLHSLYGLDKS